MAHNLVVLEIRMVKIVASFTAENMDKKSGVDR